MMSRGVSLRDRGGTREKQTHASGEKCATQLFTETQVGKASPEMNENDRDAVRIGDQTMRSISDLWKL